MDGAARNVGSSLMRRALAPVVLACLLSLPARARASDAEVRKPADPKNVVLADLGLHVIALGYQRTLSDHVALSVSSGLYDPWTVTEKVGDIRGAMLRVRPYFFFTDHAPRGVWISPFAQGAVVRGTSQGEARTGGAFALGAAAGYAFLFGGVVHLSLGVGGQLHYARVGTDAPPSFYTAGIHIDGTVGFAF
jgi:hypothetical protein